MRGFRFISKVVQSHVCTVYIRCLLQGDHQIYGHMRCIYKRFRPTLCIMLSAHWRCKCAMLHESCIQFNVSEPDHVDPLS